MSRPAANTSRVGGGATFGVTWEIVGQGSRGKSYGSANDRMWNCCMGSPWKWGITYSCVGCTEWLPATVQWLNQSQILMSTVLSPLVGCNWCVPSPNPPCCLCCRPTLILSGDNGQSLSSLFGGPTPTVCQEKSIHCFV